MGARSLWTASLFRSLVAGGALGLGVGLMASGGCGPGTEQEYNEELAVALCDVQRGCDNIDLSAMGGAQEFPSNSSCEDTVVTQFDGCSGNCKFKRAAARKCIRRLETIAGDCKRRSLAPCRRTYRDCATPEEASRCNLNASCSARVGAPNSGGLPWLLMLVVGGAGVFRRRTR